MLLLYVTASCVLFGSAAGIQNEEKCYGSTLSLPRWYLPGLFNGQMYFISREEGSKKLIMDNGMSKDPRLEVSIDALKFKDLRNEGTFSILNGNRLQDIMTLEIKDCSDKIIRYYGDIYQWDIPSKSEYLEFYRLNGADEPVILWNRSSHQSARLTRYARTLQINDLTQADNGHYNLRAKDDTLLHRIQLQVKEHVKHLAPKLYEWVLFEKLFDGPLWTVTFIPRYGKLVSVPLIERGRLIEYRYAFERRLWIVNGALQIQDVEMGDSGTFLFRDQQGNLAQIVEMDVSVVTTTLIVCVTVGTVIVTIACCCCVRKCCCKKSSPKREEPPLPVFYHGSTQPASSSHSASPAPYHSYQPVNPLVPKEPSATSLEPSVNNPVNVHVIPPQPEVAPLGGQRTDPAPTLGSDCLSSDPGPQFELKGLSFPSAPPLGSDPTFSDVYSSDKLNFL